MFVIVAEVLAGTGGKYTTANSSRGVVPGFAVAASRDLGFAFGWSLADPNPTLSEVGGAGMGFARPPVSGHESSIVTSL